MTFPSLEKVRVNDPFWSPVQELIRDVVIPYQYDILSDRVPEAAKSHAIENFRIAAGESDGEFYGMVFQDSDVAKWLEAAAYSLALKPDPSLEARADELIDLVGRAQQPDGYLNTYFTVKEPEHRWQNLAECHELYCAGHMMEAAAAYYFATGKTRLLEIMRRYANLICSRFGRGEGQVRGVPGHQEIELGLLRMHEATGEARYLDTAQYFIDERGREPEYLTHETLARDWYHWGKKPAEPEYNQRHAPVREQTDAVGHSVRAGYMYAAMAELAGDSGEAALKNACERIWSSIVNKRMYITGGIGSSALGEAFTADYDLPGDLAYAETCASVAMVFFARRMLELTPKGEYADVMETQLYNGILAGMQLDGRRFFYVNPLEVVPGVSGVVPAYRHVLPKRPAWYDCACCPPNVARLFASLGRYLWGEQSGTVFVHSYLGGSYTANNGAVITCRSAYPWQGEVEYEVSPGGDGQAFVLALHIPAWCRDKTVFLNGKRLEGLESLVRDGYLYLDRTWQKGDTLRLELELTVRRVYANTAVRAAAGCTALLRGPVVYCAEEADNGKDLCALRISRAANIAALPVCDESLGNIVLLKAAGVRLQSDGGLYAETLPKQIPAVITAIPYYAWGNRAEGAMRVWLLENAQD